MTAITTRRGLGVFVWWAVADVVSVVGSRLAALAVPWFVLTTTGSAAQTGLVALAQLGPMVVCKALSGPVLDRVGPAAASVRLDIVSAVVTALVPVAFVGGWLSLPALLALVALDGALRGPADAAKYALVPAVAVASGQPLERVTGVAGTTERFASSVGAAGGGVLVALLGAAQALVVTAAGFALSSLLIAVAVGPRVRPVATSGGGEPAGADATDVSDVPAAGGSPAPVGGLRRYGRDLLEGWAFLRRDAVLFAIVVMVAVTNLLDQAWVAVLVPVWARSHGHGPEVVGWAFATMTGAAIVGSLIATVAGPRLPRLPVYTVGFLLNGLPRFVVLAADTGLPVVLAVLAVAGVASGVLNPIIAAVQFERTPEALVGRVSSSMSAAAWSLMPFGGLLAGLLIAGVGLGAVTVGLGLAYLAATLAPLVLPAFGDLGRRST